ncbi:RING-H2 finger protein ATL32 [Cryptomeria japonica]|uniref:RING-H2 finger protein ATL32 n=1 Tax=Cryptomeria japonica TaxID=3369 RepID=UPI0027D9EA42|nr:RING-H2 finger protein ATL32 [Cryptomeria japonica]
MEKFVAEDRNSFLVGNLASIPTIKVVSMADNSINDNPEANHTDSGYDSQAIKIMGLLSFIFLIGFSVVCIRRRMTVGVSRQAGANNNVKGLDRAVIESFPVFSYNLVKGLKAQAKGSECAVCLSDFQDEELVRLLPKCSHAFHPECIDMWLWSHTTCPVCRASLLPADNSIPIATVEMQTPPEQVAIVIDNGNNETTNGASETSHDSMGHSLVRARTEMELPTEWYIDTPGGRMPGLHRSCSFIANHHSQAPSTSKARPVCSKPGGSQDDSGHGSKSKRWGHISMNSGSFLRSFTDHVATRTLERRGSMEQRSHKPHVGRTLSWVMAGERERNRAEGTENGSATSRHAIQFEGTSIVLSSKKVKGIPRFKSF